MPSKEDFIKWLEKDMTLKRDLNDILVDTDRDVIKAACDSFGEEEVLDIVTGVLLKKYKESKEN